MQENFYDVAIIGCGITGAAAAYELAKYDIRLLVLERENDVANGTTKANSAILHAGYDPAPGSQMAALNVRGAQLSKQICHALDVPYSQCGSMVLAFDEQERQTLETLLERGIKNGVPDLKIIERAELFLLEPNVSKEAVSALYAPSAAVVSPWELALALVETAVKNGADLMLNAEVSKISKQENGFEIASMAGNFCARYIINAAGVFADTVHDMAAAHEFSIVPTKGEYFLLDKSEGDCVSHVMFQCPSKEGKGVLVSPTVHGNLIVGPDSHSISSKTNTATTREGLDFVEKTARKTVPQLNLSANIRNFCGVRADAQQDDFIIKETTTAGFIDAAGIKSPGLTAAPAVAERLAEILQSAGLELNAKADFINSRKRIKFAELSTQEQSELCQQNASYGEVICRCESITKAEIISALRSPVPPCSIDGVKRRVGSGMGRCQGGFCGPKIAAILSEELGICMSKVLQDSNGSNIIFSRTKEGI